LKIEIIFFLGIIHLKLGPLLFYVKLRKTVLHVKALTIIALRSYDAPFCVAFVNVKVNLSRVKFDTIPMVALD